MCLCGARRVIASGRALTYGYAMQTVLVTGGAGFLGSHLCDALVARGDHVICLDNFFTGRLRNIAPLMDRPNFELIRHDITEPILLEVDAIYNLACPASPVHYQYNPVKTLKTCVFGTMNMLGLAKRVKAKILQASTSEIYGDPQVHPQSESYWGHVNPIGVRSCYDEGKRCAETLMFDYRRDHGIDIKVARIFNTYGPRMNPDDGRVVSNFLMQARAGEPITVYGDGAQTRAFCYVDDMIAGLIALMEQPDGVTGPVNLGNPEETDMNTLARLVRGVAGSDSAITHVALPSDDPRRRCPDIALARDTLGWEPTTSLEDGLARTLAYMNALEETT